MTANVGQTDRILRFVVGALLIALPFIPGLGFMESAAATTISILIGLVLVLTASFRFCPLYRMLGINSCQAAEQR